MSYSHIHQRVATSGESEAPLPEAAAAAAMELQLLSSAAPAPVGGAQAAALPARPAPVEALHAEIAFERRRLAELEASLRHFSDQNADQKRQLDATRAQNAELSLRISTSANDRSAAEARLSRYRQDAESLGAQQAALDAELVRLREELAMAEAEAAAEEQRTSQSEAAAAAAAARAEADAAARELEMRASIVAHREQLAARQREASGLRATLEEREGLEAQAAELRARLVSAKAWQLHRQLVAAQRDGRAALEALEAEATAAVAERQQLDAELAALSADRDRLLLEMTACVQSKQAAAAQLIAAKRDLAFATLDSEAAHARAARERFTAGNASTPGGLDSLAESESLGLTPPPVPLQNAPSASPGDADVLSAVEADSAATLAEMRSLLLSLQGHTAAGSTAIMLGGSPTPPRASAALPLAQQQHPLPADADLAAEMRSVAALQAALL